MTANGKGEKILKEADNKIIFFRSQSLELGTEKGICLMELTNLLQVLKTKKAEQDRDMRR